MSSREVRAPMTKTEWQKQQSIVRRVHDPATGRNRYVWPLISSAGVELIIHTASLRIFVSVLTREQEVQTADADRCQLSIHCIFAYNLIVEMSVLI